ncbi:A disintegrin and metalloproteinase with thrombospondin motifs family protein, partial [Euroglyphus maynei]
MKFIDANNNNNVRTFYSCEHQLNFIGNFNQHKRMTMTMKRKKRSYSSERTIEISIVTDLSMYLYHENSLRNYVFTLIAMVSHLFKHSSIGNEINIKLVKLTSLIDEQQEKNWYGSAHRTLRHFCRWQYEHNHPNDDHPLHYDTAILLTKIDLCSKNDYNPNNEMDRNVNWRRTMTKITRSSCDTLGLAHSGQICDPETSCAIVEDNGLSAAFTIAHELGHLLGVPHDDEEQCKRFYEQTNDDTNNKRSEFNVMVRMIDSNSHMWSWSSCSKHFMTEFLDSGHGDCLLDNNSMDIRQSSIDSRVYETFRRRSFIDKYSKLPAGALYNADEQCRLVFDRNSSICLDMPYCRKLWCTSNTVGGCRTQHMPWADGTECGNGYWCQEGQCVRIDHTALHPIDGGWSDWSQWSDCSLNCGGGIRRSRRDCTNPKPQNGGKFCIGERIRYESCNLEPCQYQSRSEDSRAQQCAEYNRYNITWTPKYDAIPSSDVCALYCESNSGESHKLKSRVIDGTPCTPESFDICVNGKCLMAGCDRILGSNRRVDYCGVCGGNNSTCREINGQFKPRTVQHGYTFVLSIPPGATNVEIVKEPSSASADNWLALRGEYGNYLLNGHFTVNVYERKWYYGGTTVEYSGTKSHGYERINITHAIHNPLHLEILCVGELHLPSISFHFAVTSDNGYISYKWMIESYWSTCNKACNGEQERKRFCVAIMRPSWLMDNSQPQISEIKVNDDYCDQQQRPSTEYRVCNVHCELEWHIHQTGSCSSKCGHGFRQLKINCTQTFINHNERIYIDDFYCHHLGPKPPEMQNCTGSDCHITYQWQYSEWSQCTMLQHHHTCGQGQQNRIAHCISSTYLDNDPSNVIHSNVGQELCQQHLSDPILLQSCQVECPHWQTDQWSECKGSCSTTNGERHRTVSCMHGEQQVSDAYCQIMEPKPADRITCELIECREQMNDFYQLDNRTDQHHRRQSDEAVYHIAMDTESMINNNEIYGYHHGHVDTSTLWQSGEWSSCDILSQYVREYHNRFTENFHLPECFDSMEQVNILRERFLPLFHLNNSLHSNSYTDLAHLLGLDEAKLKRRRYVACVDAKNQQVMTDNECDLNVKPNSEEYCPIEQSLLRLMPEFNVHLCPSSSTSTTTIDSLLIYEIESKKSNSIQHYQQAFIEQMEWRTGQWSDCFCDSNRLRFIRRRSVHCIRVADGNNIRDEYCHHNQPLLVKPIEIEECTTQTTVNECDPYSRQTSQKQILKETSTASKPTIISTPTSFTEQTPILPIDETTLQHHSTKSEPILHTTTNDQHQNSINEMSTSLPAPIINESDGNGWTEWYDWSECSVKCGNGVQTRESKCSSKISQQQNKCDERQRPKRQYRSCYRMCSLFEWHYSDWSPCQAECGHNGIRTRTAECHDWTGTRVSDHFCENVDHPSNIILKEQCHRMDCKLVWRTGQWSECSKLCGFGQQIRTVNCHRINKFGIIDPRPLEYIH